MLVKCMPVSRAQTWHAATVTRPYFLTRGMSPPAPYRLAGESSSATVFTNHDLDSRIKTVHVPGPLAKSRQSLLRRGTFPDAVRLQDGVCKASQRAILQKTDCSKFKACEVPPEPFPCESCCTYRVRRLPGHSGVS
jgi:hypothetical protein